jgi:hypothetical protein
MVINDLKLMLPKQFILSFHIDMLHLLFVFRIIDLKISSQFPFLRAIFIFIMFLTAGLAFA